MSGRRKPLHPAKAKDVIMALIKAINEFVQEYQKNPRPFVWTVDADDILRKVAKLRHLQETGR